MVEPQRSIIFTSRYIFCNQHSKIITAMKNIYQILTLLLLISSCHSSNNKPKSIPIKVVTTGVTVDSLCSQISFTGEIEAINSATIQPRINGYLASINFKGGDRVRAGELLFTIEAGSYQSEMYAAEADVEQSLAEYLVSQRNYERAIPLVKIDAISQSDYDQYEAQNKAAKAALKASQANLKSTELNLNYTKIYAPISGIASNTTAVVGDYIGIETNESELTTISDISEVTVTLLIPTSTLLKQSYTTDNLQNLLTNITLTLANKEEYPIKGEYYYTKKDTPTNSSTVAIVAKFANPDHTLREGMFARVKADIGKKKREILIPQKAVSQMQGINSVWVALPDNTAELRTVTLGETKGDMWVIKNGLTETDRVITSGQLKVHQGAKIDSQTQK